MKKILVLLACSVCICLDQSAKGQGKPSEAPGFSWDSGWALGVKAGTMGIGGEVAKKINDSFTARFGGSFFGYTQDFDGFIFRLSFQSYSLGADWSPWQNAVHFSGALFLNRNELEVEINSITPHSLLRVSPARIDPYIGLGFGRLIPVGRRIGFSADLGLLYQGSPNVEYYTLSDAGLPVASRASITDASVLGVYLYPVLSFEVVYRIVK